MIVIAMLIKFDSPGPVIFRQSRTGWNGREFHIWKFRSMKANQPQSDDLKQATRDDDRVTGIGRFIRKTSIDELPQLFNVLSGTMSMVGPRPHAVQHNTDYDKRINSYMTRHRIKPGITGWAQLCYPYGATVEDAKEKLQYDLYYLKNHSILLDLIILIQTVEVVLVGEGAR